MIVGQKGVKYGLQVRKKPDDNPKTAPAKPNIFGDVSDDEHDNVEKQIARHAARKQADKKVAEMHAAALAEDASVFDYDSHYDSIQEARAEPRQQEKMARQSRYIATLLEKAEERKKEQDVQYERQLAKERAAEDHLYGDKEKFVTAAYKKKLEEEAKWKAEQKAKEEEEERNAVEKKGHMGDFYRNLLRNNVAFGTAAGDPEKTKKKEQRLEAAAAAPASRKEITADTSYEDDIMPERRAEMQKVREAGGASEPPARDEEKKVAFTRDPERESRSEAAPKEGREAERAVRVPEKAIERDAEVKSNGEPAATATARRNREDAVAAARERYLARKRKAENLS